MFFRWLGNFYKIFLLLGTARKTTNNEPIATGTSTKSRLLVILTDIYPICLLHNMFIHSRQKSLHEQVQQYIVVVQITEQNPLHATCHVLPTAAATTPGPTLHQHHHHQQHNKQTLSEGKTPTRYYRCIIPRRHSHDRIMGRYLARILYDVKTAVYTNYVPYILVFIQIPYHTYDTFR